MNQKLKELKKEHFSLILPILFIIIGALIRVKLLLDVPSFWLDTCALANNLERTYIDLFKPLDNIQVAPPFFMILSKFILNISGFSGDMVKKDFILLLFPCFCSIVSMPLFLYLTNKIFKNKYFNWICSFLLAFNPYAINFSIEFKQYTCELMFSLILLIIFYNLNIKTITKTKLFIISLIIAICPWFANSSLFIILSGFLIIFFNILKEKNIIKEKIFILYFPFLISIILYFLTIYIPTYQAISTAMINFWKNMQPSFITLNNCIQIFQEKLSTSKYLLNLPINILIILGINTIILFKNKNNKATYLILLPIIFTIFASTIEKYPFEPRLILFLLPLFIMIYAQIFIKIKQHKITSIILASILIFYSYKAYETPIDNYRFNNYNTRELLQRLIKHNPKLENVIADKTIFKYYINKNILLTDMMNYNFKKSQIPEFLEKAKSGEYWIYVPFTNKEYNEPLIEFLNKNNCIIIKKYDSRSTYKTFLLHIKKQ